MENRRIADVFDAIEKQSEFYFFYNRNNFDDNQIVSVNVKESKIDEILNDVLKEQNATWEIVDRNILIKVHEDSEMVSVQQQNSVNGKVTDESGQPLPGVTVLIKGTTNGTVTNNDGNYTLTNIPENATLNFSFVGMKAQEIRVGNQTTINVTLVADAIGIEEVIATGYGTQKKSDLTGSVFALKTENLQSIPNTNILQSLQGIVPGLYVTNSQSAPGSAPVIRIRGENSLSASNNPLIILDGIPFDGNLNDVSNNDVEAVSVLKDASAAAIYGARAANGVIIITTKKGEKGKAQIRYSGYYGVQSPEKKLDMMNGDQYYQLKVDIAKNQGNVTDFSPEKILNAAELPQYYAGIETDWQNMVLRAAPQQEHNISLSGASENTRYYNSINFLNQEGILEYSGMKRITFRSNFEHEITDWLKTGANIQLSNKDLSDFIYSTQADFGGKLPDFADALRISPYGQVYDDKGRYSFYPEYPNTFYNFINPFANDGTTADNLSKRAIVNLFAEINFPFIKGLTYRLNYSIDYNNQQIGNYWPSYTYYGSTYKGIAETNNSYLEKWTWENILQYKKEINDHLLDLTGLFSREGNSAKTYRQVGRGFINDDNLYHYIESATSKEIYSTLTETDLVSYMARANYNYKTKYFLTATGRVDGYSGFGENNKYGFFPSVAIGWIPTEEGFMQNAESLQFINYLKIRASYGENGNMGILPYQTLDGYRTGSYVFGNNPTTVNGLMLNKVGNPDLKWESTVTFNIGLDFAVLKNRISGNLDYYSSHSNDLLMTRQVPVMNGYTSVLYNIGETENKGFEFNLNTINIQKSNFEWTTNLNFSLNRDKIVELRGDGKDDLANSWFIGEPLRVYYDYKRIGIWQTGDDIANSAQPTVKPGFTKLQDTNSDGKITADDRVILGSRLPSWIGGMTNIFTYGDWSLSIYISTVQKILKGDNIEGTYIDVPYWREDRPDNEFKARGIVEPVAYGIYRDASYVRINDASLSYNFPKETLEKIGIANLKLYLSGKNLYTFTDWLGYDPEAANTDITYFDGPYPNSRTIVMGLNISF
jgi:TonB-linked SusC/RagA family outer membrane protein